MNVSYLYQTLTLTLPSQIYETMVESYTQMFVDNQGVNLTYCIGMQMFGFQNNFFNPISADAASLSTKAVNKSQTHMS